MGSPNQLTPYELMVKNNIEANREVLRNLGLLDSASDLKCILKPKPRKHQKLITPKQEKPKANDEVGGAHRMQRMTRRSSALFNSTGCEDESFLGDEENTPPVKEPKIKREPVFGAIEGVSVGDWWQTRIECSAAGIHRPTVAGIHGKQEEGCYSIALSGGYEDDLDCGNWFTYTGCGGRDLKGTKSNPKNLRTAPQSKDQVLEGLNAALASNVESRKPVRVIRGYKLQSPYAPEEGYRYDGLYSVEKYWVATGLSGFKVYKFALKRIPEQDPPPWELCLSEEMPMEIGEADNNLDVIKEVAETATVIGSNASDDVLTASDDVLTASDGNISPLTPLKSKKRTFNEVDSGDDRLENSNKIRKIETNEVVMENGTCTDIKNIVDQVVDVTPIIKRRSSCLKVVDSVQAKTCSTPPNSAEKRVRFSPKVFYTDNKGNDSVLPLGNCSFESCSCTDDESPGDSIACSKKQVSILKYFSPVKKSTDSQSSKSTVNPKSLRGNRFSSFSMINYNTDLTQKRCSPNLSGNKNEFNHLNNGLSIKTDTTGSAKKSPKTSSQKRKYSSSNRINRESEIDVEFTLSRKGPSMMENLIKQNNDKLRLYNQLSEKGTKKSPVKPCSVPLFRVEQVFTGWDGEEPSLHKGFEDSVKIIAERESDVFNQYLKNVQEKNYLETTVERKSPDNFHGWDSKQDTFRGATGLVPIGFIINKLCES